MEFSGYRDLPCVVANGRREQARESACPAGCSCARLCHCRRMSASASPVAAQGQPANTEDLLLEIWKRTLRIPEIERDSNFFDPDDLLQVKYEMLRQVHVDHRPISQAAHEFGFSRPSFYQANAAFEQAGLTGLVPLKRGPRSGHKLIPEVMEAVRAMRMADPSLSFVQLAALVKADFNIEVHPRSIERQLLRKEKRR